ncbi:MAG: PilW family protein [Clostridium sp.]
MKLNKKKGFTLVELVAAMGAFVLIMVALTSLVITMTRSNSTNKKTFDANSNSRAFFEALKEERPLVVKDATGKINDTEASKLNGKYGVAFNTKEELRSYVKTQLINDLTPPSGLGGNPGNFADVKALATTGQKYCLGITIAWNSTEDVYKFETWSWDVNKGESSLVNRETFLAPR